MTAPALLMSRWRCGVCCIEWERPSMMDGEPPVGCPGCGARQVKCVAAPPAVLPGVAEVVLRDVERLLKQHLDDVHKMLDGFLREESARDAVGDMAAMREAVRREGMLPPTHVERGTISEVGFGYKPDDDRHPGLRAFWVENSGKRIEITYRVLEEPSDTERPPAPMFSPEEVDTFSPVTSVAGDADELDEAPHVGRLVPRRDVAS